VASCIPIDGNALELEVGDGQRWTEFFQVSERFVLSAGEEVELSRVERPEINLEPNLSPGNPIIVSFGSAAIGAHFRIPPGGLQEGLWLHPDSEDLTKEACPSG
jgi:hypothetical protein